MKKVLAIVIALVVVAGAGFGVYRVAAKDDDTEHTQDTAVTESTTEVSSDAPSADATVITYTNSGYSPAEITVKSGTTVTIKNESSRNMQFDSDPHPAHTTNEELNVETVKPGQTQTFVVKRTGTFGYHNHLNASQTGTIIVE